MTDRDMREAIEWFNARVCKDEENNCCSPDCSFGAMAKCCAYKTAISALRERIERNNQNPLTLDELREMDGEPVFVVIADIFEPLKMWCLVEVEECGRSVCLTNNLGGRTTYKTDSCLKIDGITVYRSKPILHDED